MVVSETCSFVAVSARNVLCWRLSNLVNYDFGDILKTCLLSNCFLISAYPAFNSMCCDRAALRLESLTSRCAGVRSGRAEGAAAGGRGQAVPRVRPHHLTGAGDRGGHQVLHGGAAALQQEGPHTVSTGRRLGGTVGRSLGRVRWCVARCLSRAGRRAPVWGPARPVSCVPPPLPPRPRGDRCLRLTARAT